MGALKDLRKESKKDNENLARIFKTELDERFEKEVKPLHKKFDQLINTLDQYIKRTEEWREESMVVGAQVKRMRKVLIEKGIATEKELSL